MDATVVEEDGGAGGDGEGNGAGVVEVDVVDLGETGAGIGLGMVGEDVGAMGAGPDVEAAVFQGGIDHGDPDGDDGVCVCAGPV